jgi:hypothetical protein
MSLPDPSMVLSSSVQPGLTSKYTDSFSNLGCMLVRLWNVTVVVEVMQSKHIILSHADDIAKSAARAMKLSIVTSRSLDAQNNLETPL